MSGNICELLYPLISDITPDDWILDLLAEPEIRVSILGVMWCGCMCYNLVNTPGRLSILIYASTITTMNGQDYVELHLIVHCPKDGLKIWLLSLKSGSTAWYV